MKKPRFKPPNKVLGAALVVTGALLVKALITILPAHRFQYQEPQASPAAKDALLSPLASPLDGGSIEKLKGRNFFLSALAKSKTAAGLSTETPALPPLGVNEIRDPETGATFKYLGGLALPDAALAFFIRVGPVQKGENKFLFLPKGRSLSKNLRIVSVEEKSVKLDQAGQPVVLNVFFLDIRRSGNSPKVPANDPTTKK